jgi:hypothetical protein
LYALISCPSVSSADADEADTATHYHPAQRQSTVVAGHKAVPRTRTQRRGTSRNTKASSIDQVREGIRRFILNDVSIGDFHKALSTAMRRGELSPNPLTGAALRKIIKEVVGERKKTAKGRRPNNNR